MSNLKANEIASTESFANENETSSLLKKTKRHCLPDCSKLACKLAVVSAISVVLIIILVFVFLQWPRANEPPEIDVNIPHSIVGNFTNVAVVSNAPPCANIAKTILLKGGKAVDAMIANMLCDGVTMPQSMGIGGGFFMIIYEKSSGKTYAINARETAPAAATEDMFSGGLSIAVPGELRGFSVAYKRFGGGVLWKDLFEPTINLCEQGIPISKSLGTVIMKHEKKIKANPEFSKLFTNAITGALLEAGQTYKNLQLAKTLRAIAEKGADVFYEGFVAKDLVKDIKEVGGIITEDDLKNYQPRVEEPIQAKIFDDFTIHSSPAPSSGPILTYMMRLVDGLLPETNEIVITHRITEAMKYGYGARSRLGDPKFVDISQTMNLINSNDFIERIKRNIKENLRTWNDPSHYGGDFVEPNDKGTANLAVVSENGDAVVATSTVNMWFGSFFISKSTGIILNNEMDDFSSPNIVNYYGVAPSKANFIAPGKVPLSSMCPTIITDKNGNVRLAIGAAGGTKITTAVGIVIIRNIVYNEDIRTAVDNVLFHHQLIPMAWQYYPQIPSEIVEGMKRIGHKVLKIAPTSFAAVTAIEKRNDQWHPCSDYKRIGEVDGF